MGVEVNGNGPRQADDTLISGREAKFRECARPGGRKYLYRNPRERWAVGGGWWAVMKDKGEDACCAVVKAATTIWPENDGGGVGRA